MGERVSIAVIGGGRMGTPLVMDFLTRPFVDLVGVVDKNPDSRGAQIAKQHDIFFCTDVSELAQDAENIDMVIDVSGDPQVKKSLKEAFVASGNRTTIIVHDITARLIMSLAADSSELIETVHPEDQGIG